jgi:hypothetical protein
MTNVCAVGAMAVACCDVLSVVFSMRRWIYRGMSAVPTILSVENDGFITMHIHTWT